MTGPEPFLSYGLVKDWVPKLVKQGSAIWKRRKSELRSIFDVFGDVEMLAKTYVEPG